MRSESWKILVIALVQIILVVALWFVLLYVNGNVESWYETPLGVMIRLVLCGLLPFIGIVISIIILAFYGNVILTEAPRFKGIPTFKRKSKYQFYTGEVKWKL